MFFCPSATQEDQIANDPLRGGKATHYIGCAGPNVNSADTEYRTHSYIYGPIGMEGLFSPFPHYVFGELKGLYIRHRAYGFADIRDGASNTIAFGESSRSPNQAGFVPHRAGWSFGAHAYPLTVIGIPQFFPFELYSIRCIGNDPINTNRDYMADHMERNGHCFNSNHPGGSQFAMVDGSVKFVDESIGIELLRGLGSICQGEVVDEF